MPKPKAPARMYMRKETKRLFKSRNLHKSRTFSAKEAQKANRAAEQTRATTITNKKSRYFL